MIKVGLVQIGNEFSGQCYLPYSVGILQAYARKFLKQPDKYKFLIPIYKRICVADAVASLIEADIVGFSVYVWNFEISKAIARELKKQNPEVKIVFGGPHVPNEMKQFTRVRKSAPDITDLRPKRIGMTRTFHQENSFIDMACHGEGEKIFTAILDQMLIDGCKEKKHISSISYLDSDGLFRQNFQIPRMVRDALAIVPSPYTSGTLDELMETYPNQKWILMWETDRGCPYQCGYCDWGGATEDLIGQFDLEHVYADIEWVAKRKVPYIFLANANWGILERDILIAQKLAEVKRRTDYPEGISTQNAKNPKEHTIRALEILEEAGLNKAAVMSTQSLNPATLKAMRRDNMKLGLYYEIQRRLAAKGIYTMTDMILGMAEETYYTFAEGVCTLIERGQHNRIQFNNLSNMPNVEMNDPEFQEFYGMEMVKTKIINIHGKRVETPDGIDEWQELVIATHAMPSSDWVRTRVFSWMTGLLYFNKLLQIPFIILHEIYGIGYRDLFELFSEGNFEKLDDYLGSFPVLSEVRKFFTEAAQGIQEGKEEFIHSEEWLDIYWPPEEYIFIKLSAEGKLARFYTEAETALVSLLLSKQVGFDEYLLYECFTLNKHLIKLPFQTDDVHLKLNYNIWDFYRAVILGKKIELDQGPHDYFIDKTSERWTSWEEWCQRVVWFGNRRGAYLYGNKPVGTELAGHH